MSRKLIAVLWLGVALLFPPAHAQTGQPPLPGPWQWTDVGAVGTPGNAQNRQGDFIVSGAGSDIWGTADSFLYVYRPIRDGMIQGEVQSESSTNPFAKAGVMIRQTLDPSSPEVILDLKPDGGIEFMTRSSQGGETTFIADASVPFNNVNQFIVLRLIRNGNTVSGTYCDDRGTCTEIGSTTFPAGPALVGLAVTSHDPSTLNSVTFLAFVSFGGYDVGNVGTAGDATLDYATGTYFVSGAGSDIWGTADSFHAATQFLTDNGSATARVVSEQNTNMFAKAGVTMGGTMGGTDGTSPGDPRVILDAKPDGSLEFMARLSSGASMSFIAGASASFPVWLRLTRTGNQFAGEMSPDGQSWSTVGSVTVAMYTQYQGGLAVTSHDPSVLNMAQFDHVTVVPLPNLLINGGFEDSTPPATGPGWVSDTTLRQLAAQSETAAPRNGTKNGACRTTSLDCGIYQEVTVPAGLPANVFTFSIFASADHPGALVGVDVNGQFRGTAGRVAVGGYQQYSLGFYAHAGDVIRVWMYAPGTPGFVVIDDASLTVYTGPT
jgi:hypothetical protein